MHKISNRIILSESEAIALDKNIGISALGMYLPPTILYNTDFIISGRKKAELEEYGIQAGVKQRHFADGETEVDMAVNAIRNAFEMFNIIPEQIDVLISVNSSAGAIQNPNNAAEIQTGIGANRAFSFNINGGFNGFINALHVASAYISSGFCKTVLVVASESLINHMYANSLKSLLMGDGAAAVVVQEVDKGFGFKSFHLMSGNCEKAAGVHIDKAEFAPYGVEEKTQHFLFVQENSFDRDMPFLRKQIPYSINKSLCASKLDSSEISAFAFGQLVQPLLNGWIKELGITDEQVLQTLEKHACVENASIPILLCDAYIHNKIKSGDYVVIADQGANWSISSAVLRWNL